MASSSTASSARRCIAFLQIVHLLGSNCSAYHAPTHRSLSLKSNKSSSRTSSSAHFPIARQSTSLLANRGSYDNKGRRSSSLRISTIDVDVPKPRADANSPASDSLLIWQDVLPLSLFTAMCVAGAVVISTYEDFDVTHTHPYPSALRLPTTTTKSLVNPSWKDNFNFFGAATKGLGWGPADRGAAQGSSLNENNKFFEEWYGSSAMTLQWKPSYNEIMLQHRSERVPRWTNLEDETSFTRTLAAPTNIAPSKEQLQQAVLQLYQSLDELDDLKLMADDYNWEGMKERLNPTANSMIPNSKKVYSLQTSMEYSLETLKAMPSTNNPTSKYEMVGSTPNSDNVKELIGFDWGSCAWRHCGAKADAQESIAELYNNVGMLEPFECRFMIDIVERSIRDVLVVVPDGIKPLKDGVIMQAKPYVPYVSKAAENGDDEGMGIDYEYVQALNLMREDLSLVD